MPPQPVQVPVTVRFPPTVSKPVPVVMAPLLTVCRDRALPAPTSMVEADVPVIALVLKVKEAMALVVNSRASKRAKNI